MRMIKFTHACVRLVDGDRSLLIDPGTWAEDVAFEGATDVLVTHEHVDHIDVERLVALHGRNPDLRVYPPAPVAAQASEAAPAFAPALHGSRSATRSTRPGSPSARSAASTPSSTTAFRTGQHRLRSRRAVYHPGDSMFVPDGPVATLLVPTLAPWLKLAEAIDFVRAVRPARAYSIHDAMLSERGQAGVDRWLAMRGETDYGAHHTGDTVEL